MPHIASIAMTPANVERKPRDRFARVAADRAILIADFGIEGDLKGGSKDGDLNVMVAETVEGLRAEGYRTAPGELGEQIVIAGLGYVPLGAKLRIGPTAVIAIDEMREPCGRFERVQGKTKELAIGRIGFMARVVTGGPIAVGDQVCLDQTN